MTLGGKQARKVKLALSRYVANLCDAIRIEFGLAATVELVVRVPHESLPANTVVPATFAQELDEAEATLAEVLKPDTKGEYRVYVEPVDDGTFRLVPEHSKDALLEYLEVAAVIATDEMISRVEAAVTASVKAHSFVVLDGPSGVGKTQTALAFCTKRKALYFTLAYKRTQQAV